MKKPSLLFLTTLFTLSATALASPEKDSIRIAGGLRAFSDEDWSKIAGDQTSEKYEIGPGDTLWDISARLFGEGKVWPKIWEINNSTILNPHMIEPRTGLTFNTGSGLSLPSLVVGSLLNNAAPSTVKNHYVITAEDRPGPVWDERTPFPSNEWRNLPRQAWENVPVNLPGNIDKDGFDTRNRIYLRKPATGLELPHFVACAPIKPVGKVEGTRSITNYVYRGSEVTISSTGETLVVNQDYTILDPKPSDLQLRDRKALSYDILGKVKILGIQNGSYVGEILNTRETVMRGAILVPEIKRIEKHRPVAGAAKTKGTIIADRRSGAFMSGQYKWVYVDRGTRDGVEQGMIFRIFQNTDPKTNLPLTRGDVFVQGDAQIIQGCADFSIGIFLWSRGEVPEQYEGELVTDISDEKIRFYFNGNASELPIAEPPAAALKTPSGIIDAPKPEPTAAIIGPGPTENAETLTPSIPDEKKADLEEDWLDKLDNHKELQKEEENELKELEKFHESEAAKAPAENTDISAAPAAPPAPPANVVPPAPESGFPSEEPIVEAPAKLVKPPATQSAKAPKAQKSPPADKPVDESPDESLPL